MKALTLAILCILLTGCAGTYFTFETASKVQVGMTEAEAKKIMGKPNTITTTGGREIWVYVFATAWGPYKTVSYILVDGKVVSVPTIPASFK